MKLSDQAFRERITRFIGYRGIDIVLFLKDGSSISLEKNRQIEGDYIHKQNRHGIEKSININDIIRADFYAA